MSRSAKKGPYIDEKLLKKILKQKQTGDKTPIKTWARDSQIAPEFVGHRLAIHNGRKFIEVFITEMMVGHRLGEFALTRTFRSHGKVTKKIVEPT
ncbi:MAG: 30S ribosomal protein S19 [Patescibacteria group bacterium]|nr:30S ribosomal protein S19 [Patescibacteria group bacterium]